MPHQYNTHCPRCQQKMTRVKDQFIHSDKECRSCNLQVWHFRAFQPSIILADPNASGWSFLWDLDDMTLRHSKGSSCVEMPWVEPNTPLDVLRMILTFQ
jgi:hypothetical protein